MQESVREKKNEQTKKIIAIMMATMICISLVESNSYAAENESSVEVQG